MEDEEETEENLKENNGKMESPCPVTANCYNKKPLVLLLKTNIYFCQI